MKRCPVGDLKPGWRRHRFGEMVTSAGATRKSRGWSAREACVDRYVGLEHLDSNCLKIRRWGSPEDVGENSDLRHFEPGDVILARRGIELRKVGLAEFRGVASGHALVFRAKSEVVLPEFLPFFMQSDVFMKRADKFSVGSLSRTVNLSTLLREEFALPPMEEQRRIAEGLRIAAKAFEKSQDLSSRLVQLRDAIGLSIWNPKMNKEDLVPLGDICLKIQDGTHFSPQSDGGEFLYVTSKNIRDGYLDASTAGHISREEHEAIYKRCDVKPGDLLLTKDGANAGNIAVNALKGEFSLLSSVAFIRPDSARLDRTYAFEYLRSCVGRARLLAQVKGSAITRLTLTQIRGFTIPVPDIDTQRRLALELSEIQSRLDGLATRQAALTSVLTGMRQSLEASA